MYTGTGNLDSLQFKPTIEMETKKKNMKKWLHLVLKKSVNDARGLQTFSAGPNRIRIFSLKSGEICRATEL